MKYSCARRLDVTLSILSVVFYIWKGLALCSQKYFMKSMKGMKLQKLSTYNTYLATQQIIMQIT